jgi:two-component system, OmpR family, sensor histidine kinase CiaH
MTAVRKKLVRITVVYWFLLLYIIAALIWWFVSLEKQNQQMMSIRFSELKKDDTEYFQKYVTIEDAGKRKTAQYIGEGITFLVLILVGAGFVFRAVRREIKLSQQQQNFMMAITHELKTPIAVTRLNLETILKRQLDTEKQHKLLENTLQETNRLNELCNNVLFAAQLDAGARLNDKEQMNFSLLVEECMNSFQRRFPARTFINEIQPDIELQGDAVSLEMVVNNLIENAVKYSPKSSPITVALAHKKYIILCIKDEGSGIPDAEKEKVFDKFYRMGDESTRKAKGTGLGLYISKRIASNHNANLFAENNKPQGTVMKLIFR